MRSPVPCHHNKTPLWTPLTSLMSIHPNNHPKGFNFRLTQTRSEPRATTPILKRPRGKLSPTKAQSFHYRSPVRPSIPSLGTILPIGQTTGRQRVVRLQLQDLQAGNPPWIRLFEFTSLRIASGTPQERKRIPNPPKTSRVLRTHSRALCSLLNMIVVHHSCPSHHSCTSHARGLR